MINETATPKETTKPSTETTEDNHVLGREQFNAHNTFDTFVIRLVTAFHMQQV